VKNMTRLIKYGNVQVGNGNLITVQSMTNTKTYDVKSTVEQILKLEEDGCDIIRVAVPEEKSSDALKEIKKEINIPLIADIHFDYKLAIESIKAGISKIRLNPGNIGSDWKVKEVLKAAKEYNIPIRVGANSGSLDKRFENDTIEMAMVNSALYQVRLLEKNEFDKIVISMKSSDVRKTYLSNKIISEKIDYPLHLGVTEAGVYEDSIISSSAGIGALLLNNIGDTI